MSHIPEQYQPQRIDPQSLDGWLNWSLDFFSAPVLQNPYLDITLQLDVSEAYAGYQAAQAGAGGTFFAYLVWHLAQALATEPSFNLRCVDGDWYTLRNPPIFIPVAVGGAARFRDIVLDDVYGQDYRQFLDNYLSKLSAARHPASAPTNTSDVLPYAHFVGNLPYLRFTGLTLHWRPDQMIGQSQFYFGQRYQEGSRLLIPFAAKLHHGCTDPLVLNELLLNFGRRFHSG